MIKIYLISLINIILILTCIAYKYDKPIYRNLYGFEKDSIPPNKAFLNVTVGALKFIQESERIINSKIRESTPLYNQEYDFIVVGAGSAGATIASRLSEIPEVTVLLVEAGPMENLIMDVPLIVNYFQLRDEINWKDQTEPSTSYCQGMTDRRCNWPHGKVMGGSSVLNYMIATRGNFRDYDQWEEMGNYGWSYKKILKYFKKLESMGIEELKSDETMHNTKGPLHIDYPPYHTPLAQNFLEAGIEMGFPTIDYNGKDQIGFSYIQATMKNGLRMSTNRAYLSPARKRKNLFVSRHSFVNKILIDPETKTAYGVDFTKLNNNIQVKARKEVILSAGTIGSAKILMLSGVGPSEHLTQMGIDVVKDAPVGENLMDHIAYGGLVFFVNQSVSITRNVVVNPMKPYLSDFLNNKQGPYTVPGGCEALAFINVDDMKSRDVLPNLEFIFIGGSVISDTTFYKNFGISNDYWDEIFNNFTGRHSWTIFPMLLHPKSRGKILLRDNNPNSKPKIFANYLNDPEDVRILIMGVKAAIEVSKTKAMQQFKSDFYDFDVPGCENYTKNTDEYWECAVRTFTLTIYHYSGTCKMAPDDDPTGVVNPKLQVKGIKRLRVGDASIMPTIITGHTNIPTVMIGEKLADMIKEDWS